MQLQSFIVTARKSEKTGQTSWAATNLLTGDRRFVSNKSLPKVEGDIVEYKNRKHQIRTIDPEEATVTLWFKEDPKNELPDDVITVSTAELDKMISNRVQPRETSLYVGRYVEKQIGDKKEQFVELVAPLGKTYIEDLNNKINKHRRRR
jgi:hypothetical protein